MAKEIVALQIIKRTGQLMLGKYLPQSMKKSLFGHLGRWGKRHLKAFDYPTDLAIVSAAGLRLMMLWPNELIAGYTLFMEGFDVFKISPDRKLT